MLFLRLMHKIDFAKRKLYFNYINYYLVCIWYFVEENTI